ncbi:MAG: hypothetical protein ABIR55_09370 [Burkholderiaceae bacterium]
MVDDQIDRHERIDALDVGAGEILHQDACPNAGERRLGAVGPIRKGLDGGHRS